jgi:anthranilate phosphoribosyltransferase
LQFRVWIYSWDVLNRLVPFQQQLANGIALSADDAAIAVEELVREDISAEHKADFLIALARKGETVEEIAAFAQALREKSIVPPLDPATRSREILDVCGTGGDHLKTFNISTTVALVVAAGGVTVAKHGNRAVTSQSGSADVLEALGIRVDLSPEEAAATLRDHQFAFLFAPKYHPAFKHLALARRMCAQRGQRTIFNLLGPLLNPARPTAQLIGVPRPEFCEPLARVLQTLGIRRGMVVSGKVQKDDDTATASTHLDELSIFGENFIAEFFQEGGYRCSTFLP